MQGIGRKNKAAGWRHKSPARLALVLFATMSLVQAALGQITNTVTASGSHGGLPVTGQASESVSVAAAAPSMNVVKSGTLNDDDGNAGLTAGDSITYSLVVDNTGNVSLTGVVVTDPLASLALTSGDTANPGVLDPDEVWTYSASYILTALDISGSGGGDGDIDNTAVVDTNQLPDQPASASVTLTVPPSLDLEKSVISLTNPYPNIFEIEYSVRATNTGSTLISDIAVSDDLAAAFAPASLVGTPVATLSGFGGTGGVNPSYDGSATPAVLQGDVQLAASSTGEIRITARFNTATNAVNTINTAVASAPQLPSPVTSDDPSVTPGNPGDTNPTPLPVTDADRDGSPDGTESGGSDRDGDGTPDAQDYDPTGYFYCQADGRILSGGLVTVTNTGTGGSQSGVGTSSNITILADGSSGFYQFHVSADGIYRLTYTLPSGGVASTTRLAGPTLDLTSFLPANPGVLGSGETGSSGILASFTAAANPFHTEFAIEAGDPAVFNNNIPLENCGSPLLAASKTITSGPAQQPDGRTLVSFAMTVSNAGTEAAQNLTVADDLAGVFGAGLYAINAVALGSVPPGFAASINPAFDGNATTSLLTGGGTLAPGETATVNLTLLLSVPAGLYTNTVEAGGTSPVDNGALPPASASVDTPVATAVAASGIVVQKRAGVALVDRGQPVPYTLVIENRQATARSGIDIVDLVPVGFTYVAGSAVVDAAAIEPLLLGRELVWTGLTLPANGTVTITLSLTVGAAAAGPEFVNYLFARDAATGDTLSNVAEAKVRLRIEPVFDCPDIIGRVFDDANRDGYMQDGEKGIAGVRLATARGLLITTDAQGRFHIACPVVPDAAIGSNFIVKLDTRTLPQGYEVTSENPRTVRLTRGKLVKLNFGAAGLRLVEFGLDARSFENGSTRLKRTSLAAIDQLLSELASQQANLRITYSAQASDKLKDERLKLVASLVKAAFKARGGSYDLQIETRLKN